MSLKLLIQNLVQNLKGLPIIHEGEISAEIFKRLFKQSNPVIVEIGANDGQHTKWFKQHFPRAQIHCFEPDSRAVERFKQNTKDLSDVSLYQVALSDKDGYIDFYPSISRKQEGEKKPWDASGSIKRPTQHITLHPDIDFGEPIKIQTTTLDSWCLSSGIKNINLIWMDVQGAEMDVFSGAKESLAITEWLYTEYSVIPLYDGAPSLYQILRKLNTFRPHLRFRNDILLKNKTI
jgi:FkbM family methyltransferase